MVALIWFASIVCLFHCNLYNGLVYIWIVLSKGFIHHQHKRDVVSIVILVLDWEHEKMQNWEDKNESEMHCYWKLQYFNSKTCLIVSSSDLVSIVVRAQGSYIQWFVTSDRSSCSHLFLALLNIMKLKKIRCYNQGRQSWWLMHPELPTSGLPTGRQFWGRQYKGSPY